LTSSVLAAYICRFKFGTYLFVELPWPGGSEVQSDLFGLWVKLRAASLPPVTTQSIHSKVEAIPFSNLPKDTTSELAGQGMQLGFC